MSKLTKERIENEMSWLRCINFDKESDVRRAAIEILMSVDKELTILQINGEPNQYF